MKDLCPKKCPERNATCHIDCQRHNRYRKNNAEEKERRQKEIAVIVYQLDQKRKYLEAKRKHKARKKEKDK